MAKIDNGVIWPPLGCVGPNLFRKHRTRGVIVVPRYRRDRHSPEQLEQRRRFRRLTKIASRLYLPLFRQFRMKKKRGMTEISRFVKLNMPAYFEWNGMPHVHLWEGVLPELWQGQYSWMPDLRTLSYDLRYAVNPFYASDDYVCVVTFLDRGEQIFISPLVPFGPVQIPIVDLMTIELPCQLFSCIQVIRNRGIRQYSFSMPWFEHAGVGAYE